MHMRVKGIRLPEAIRDRVPKLGLVLAILGAPIILILQGLLIQVGWNHVIAASSSIEPIGIWQGTLFMLVYKLCLKNVSKPRRSNPTPGHNQSAVPPKAPPPDIVDIKPSAQ